MRQPYSDDTLRVLRSARNWAIVAVCLSSAAVIINVLGVLAEHWR